jgi:hypothetical protein
MPEDYCDLRAVIFATTAEKNRFRQLIVNSVMATDIMDKDLKALRNNSWDKAFKEWPQVFDLLRLERVLVLILFFACFFV